MPRSGSLSLAPSFKVCRGNTITPSRQRRLTRAESSPEIAFIVFDPMLLQELQIMLAMGELLR